MKTCLKCGNSGIPDSEKYCPIDGSKNLVVNADNDPASATAGTKATKQTRVAAFAIDQVVINIIGAFSIWVPIIPALLAASYQLLRDVGGASVGKRVLKLRVISQNGAPITPRQCILRNILFFLPTLALFIPFLGFFADNGVALFIYVIEIGLLYGTGLRMGDRIAGTTVVKD